MKLFTIIVVLLMSVGASAQIGISGGGSMLKAFGNPKPYGGFHIGVEVPRDDAITINVRVSHQFKQRSDDSTVIALIAYDVNTFPYIKNIGAISSFNYTILEAGTRYYIGNGYDFGWSGYGGTNLFLAVNNIKMEYGEFDEGLYELPQGSTRKGSIISGGAGLSVGVKYSMPTVGTFYFDTGLSYAMLVMASNSLAEQEGGVKWKQLTFNFNLGFRKDILW